LGKKPSGKSLTLLAKKAKHELVDEVRHFLRRAAPPHLQHYGGKLVGRFLGQSSARFLRPETLGIVKDSP
jgi:hypothetical protein